MRVDTIRLGDETREQKWDHGRTSGHVARRVVERGLGFVEVLLGRVEDVFADLLHLFRRCLFLFERSQAARFFEYAHLAMPYVYVSACSSSVQTNVRMEDTHPA